MKQDAAVALQRYYDTLVRTLKRRVDWTYKDFIRATYELMNKEEVTLVRRGMTTVFSEDDIFRLTARELGTFEETISQSEFRKRMCKLLGVIKQQERGHLEGRSIACCSIPFKLINYVFEELASNWLGVISAIKMTGLRKVNTLLSLAGRLGEDKIGLTADNSKWNECIPIGSTVLGVRKIMHLLHLEGHIKKTDFVSIMNFSDVYTWMYEHKYLGYGKGISVENNNNYQTVDDPKLFLMLNTETSAKAR